jgi:predicted phage terminase large subunit-like protein
LASELGNCSGPEQIAIARHYCLTDLYWLLWFGCGRRDLEKEWLFARCREVQESPNGHLDLWAREHYKSTIITFGLTIQDILNDPELTFGIFSHTRPIAKQFLRQIKREFEANKILKALFPEILWGDPQKEAPKWSEDEGIIVRRKGNPKEATVEAWGLVDGQPISKHFSRMVYDDVVTRESVNSPEMIAKTTEMWELSRNLGAEGGTDRHAGTRYHFNDSYKEILKRGITARLYPATKDGTVEGEPVLMSREALDKKRREQGPYTFACQMLQNPVADRIQGFKRDWLRFWKAEPEGNKYMLVDAASEKKQGSDYTAIWVVALGEDGNYYAVDMVRDRMNLTERADRVMRLHRKHRPLEVRYERYGMMADIEHLKTRQEAENYRFDVVEVGGATPKNDRIRRLIPIFEQAKFYLPETFYVTDYEGIPRDMVQSFIEEEYAPFPVALHDDMFDGLARLCDSEGKVNGETRDLSLVWPMPDEEPKQPDRYARKRNHQRSAWAA